MPPREYYQFGGFQPQVDWFRSSNPYYGDEKELAAAIAGPSSPLRTNGNANGPVEIVLGIKPHGTSHLLLTHEQMEAFASSRGFRIPGRSLSAYAFESLSPISFQTVDELSKKLSSLKPKSTKNKNGGAQDTSQANRIYSRDMLNDYRGAFEHGRVLYQILNQRIMASHYGVDDTAWKQGLLVTSFVVNTKAIDHRSSEEKVKNPTVLDVGFCHAQLPSLDANNDSAKHIISSKNSKLGGRGPKKHFSHGQSEIVPDASIPARIQELFKDHQKRTETPMILLVCGKELTKNYLLNMGVDTSTWCLGLKDLLMPGEFQRVSSSSNHNPRRSRSQSPRRGGQRNLYENRRSNRRSRSRSPRTSRDAHKSPASAGRLYSPVFVLDVEQLYIKLMGSIQLTGVVDIARQFGLENVDGFCAGNEAVMLINIWKAMISGLPIDEQGVLRRSVIGESDEASQSQPTPGAGPSNTTQADLESDDEQDPNDVVQAPAAPSRPGHYNFEESDYASSSDSD